jgi:hypothetical protein
MNKLHIILLSLLVLAVVQSCEPSLGYDEFGQVDPVDKNDTTKTFIDSTENQYSVEKTEYTDFIEVMNFEDTELEWKYEITKNVVKIDTTLKNTTIWMDLDFNNPTPVDPDSWHFERIKSFKMKFRGELNDDLFILNGKELSGKWFEVTIWKQISDKNSQEVYPAILPQVSIDEINTTDGYIAGKISINLEDASSYLKRFKGKFKLYYEN